VAVVEGLQYLRKLKGSMVRGLRENEKGMRREGVAFICVVSLVDCR